MMIPMKYGDIYLSSGRGGRRPRRPAPARRRCARENDIAGGHLEPHWADRAYARGDRESMLARRLERARPASQWWTEQRERVLAQDLAEPVKVMFSESMRLEPGWAAEYQASGTCRRTSTST